jgi:hypothetical protein
MPFRFVPRDGVQSKLLTKKTAAAYGTPFKGKRLRLRSLAGLTQCPLPALPGQHRPITGPG